MKLISDLVAVVPPLGLAVIIQFLQDPHQVFDTKYVTLKEFCSNGYIMLMLITLALIIQAFLSQNSTHLVTVEGTRLKTALQVIVNQVLKIDFIELLNDIIQNNSFKNKICRFMSHVSFYSNTKPKKEGHNFNSVCRYVWVYYCRTES